jgi:hypothetical protein
MAERFPLGYARTRKAGTAHDFCQRQGKEQARKTAWKARRWSRPAGKKTYAALSIGQVVFWTIQVCNGLTVSSWS